MSTKHRRTNMKTMKEPSVDEHFEFIMNDESFMESTDKKVSIDDLPPWFDEEMFNAGQRFHSRNVFGVSLGSFLGLMTVLTIPSVLKILISTKKSSTPCTAFKRYTETLLHTIELYNGNIKDPSGRWWQSLNVIRQKHATGSKLAVKAGAGNILQRDMALTQFGFIGYPLVAPDKLTIVSDPNEIEGFIHFWRVVGYLIGISDKVNICRESSAETLELCRKILNTVKDDFITNQSEICKKMINILIDGFMCVDFLLDNDAIIYYWHKVHGIKYDKPMSFYSKLNIMYRNSVIYIIGIPIIGDIIRIGFNKYLLFNYWITSRWPIGAYLRFGYKQSKLNLYPSELS